MTFSAAPALADGSAAPASDGTPQVLANAGAAGNYFLDHLQYEHLDQPELGFGEAIANPGDWATHHLGGVALDTADLALTGQNPNLYNG
ncbi:MAG: hypothetical protein J2O48_13500 [Solirubrobacterales bacterium]|nr:hypothetical protein [Solirubrobacterales bacterium]